MFRVDYVCKRIVARRAESRTIMMNHQEYIARRYLDIENYPRDIGLDVVNSPLLASDSYPRFEPHGSRAT